METISPAIRAPFELFVGSGLTYSSAIGCSHVSPYQKHKQSAITIIDNLIIETWHLEPIIGRTHKSWPALATIGRMANEVIILTLAMAHAVRSVVADIANFITLRPHPAIRTPALAVVRSAGAVVQAGAVLRTRNPPRIGRARSRAIIALPAGETAARSRHMVALCAVLAATFTAASAAVESLRARLLAAGTSVSSLAEALPCFRIAASVT